MKRFIFIFIVLLLLIAVFVLRGGGWKCSNGICIKVRSAGPIKKNSSVPIVINVRTDRNHPAIDIILSIDAGGTIEDAADKSDVALINNEGVAEIVWKKKMQALKEITITQNVHVQGPADYTIRVMAVLPSGVVSDGMVFRITEEGATEYHFDTYLPPGTPNPLVTVTPGPSPTFLPTDTPNPSPTPVAATLTPTEAPSPIPTEPAYPYP